MTRGGPGLPSGSATISQSFGCGSSFESGSCVVALDDNFARIMDAAATITIKVDGNQVHTADHTANVDGFIPVTFSADCGWSIALRAVPSSRAARPPLDKSRPQCRR